MLHSQKIELNSSEQKCSFQAYKHSAGSQSMVQLLKASWFLDLWTSRPAAILTWHINYQAIRILVSICRFCCPFPCYLEDEGDVMMRDLQIRIGYSQTGDRMQVPNESLVILLYLLMSLRYGPTARKHCGKRDFNRSETQSWAVTRGLPFHRLSGDALHVPSHEEAKSLWGTFHGYLSLDFNRITLEKPSNFQTINE